MSASVAEAAPIDRSFTQPAIVDGELSIFKVEWLPRPDMPDWVEGYNFNFWLVSPQGDRHLGRLWKHNFNPFSDGWEVIYNELSTDLSWILKRLGEVQLKVLALRILLRVLSHDLQTLTLQDARYFQANLGLEFKVFGLVKGEPQPVEIMMAGDHNYMVGGVHVGIKATEMLTIELIKNAVTNRVGHAYQNSDLVLQIAEIIFLHTLVLTSYE